MSDRERILGAWNATEADVPAVGLVELFLRQAAAAPDRIAVLCGEDALTYAELAERSARMAAALVRAGVRRETRVGVYLDRSLDLVTALLAVLRCGGSYVPLDVMLPAGRIEQIVGAARPPVVVVDRGRPLAGAAGAVTVFGDAWRDAPAAAQDAAFEADAIAYAMFTSGSTGVPKGVEVTHGALVNFLWSMRERPGLAAGDVLVAVTTTSFDISGLELYLPLVTGARVVLCTRRIAADGAALARLLDECGATVLQATPATWRMLLAAGWTGRRELRALCGGEALPPDLARSLRETTRALWNLYGPTETTIWSTLDEVTGDGPISIGRPIANTRCYVLDDRVELAPPGREGELFIAGRGLARGYLSRPGLTAERFVPDPFRSGERMYRTGDVARWGSDGRLEHLGRSDHQVKLRGFRIELGEIEAQLVEQPGVREAVVVARDEPGGKRLIGYVTGEATDPAALRAGLAARLPEYMIPAAFVVLRELPLTPNGKVDRRALPAPGDDARAHTAYEPPRTERERRIAAIWCDVLGVARVGRLDSFFALGGDSLRAFAAVVRVNEELAIALAVTALFEEPTLAGFAALVEAAPREVAGSPRIGVPQLRAAGHTEGPAVLLQPYYHAMFEADPGMGPPLVIPILWRLRGPLDAGSLERALDAVATRHEVLRTTYERRAGELRQIVRPAAPPYVPALRRRELAELGDVTRGATLAAAIAAFERPMDLARGPVLDAELIRIAPDDHALLVAMHHVVYDGPSVALFFDELAAAYRSFASGAARAPEPALPCQFLDVATYLERYRESPAGQLDVAYWRDQLAGITPLELPADLARDAVEAERAASRAASSGRNYVVHFPYASVARQIDARPVIAAAGGDGPALLVHCLAALAELLHAESGQRDLVIQTALNLRPLLGAGALIGGFNGPVFLRVRMPERATRGELVAQLRQLFADAYAHALISPNDLVPGFAGRVNFGFGHVAAPVWQLGAATGRALPGVPGREVTPFDLRPSVVVDGDRLTVALGYNTRLFARTTAERLCARYAELVGGGAGA